MSISHFNSIERRVFMLWTGDEVMTNDREQALKKIEVNDKIKVTLITKNNLHEYVLKDYPLHPAYEYLSTVHKSDYLRCYVMHHYGGGYCDMKDILFQWEKGFDMIESNPDLLMIGIKPIIGHLLANIEEYTHELRNELIEKINSLCYMGGFIFRPQSPITTEWYNELNNRLDKYLPKLILNPSKYTRECFDSGLGFALPAPTWELPVQEFLSEKSDYPLSWNIILAQILYPIQLKYLDKISNKI